MRVIEGDLDNAEADYRAVVAEAVKDSPSRAKQIRAAEPLFEKAVANARPVRAATSGPAEAAKKAESTVKTGQGIEVALDSLSCSLAAIVEGIRAQLPTEVFAGEASADPTAAADSLGRLKKMLESDDGEAADFILDAGPNLCGVLTGAEIDTLAELVGNFDFAAALRYLSGIAARLSLNVG
jgi:hypothetical protein